MTAHSSPMPILEHDRTLLRSWTRTTAIRLAGPRYWSNLPPAKTSDNRTCHTAKATTRQPDILCVWLVRPVAWNSLPLDIRSAPTLSTFKNMLKTHLCLRSYFTDCFQRTLYGSLVVTLAMLPRLIS